MALKPVIKPSDNKILDQNGELTLDYQRYLKNLEKKPGEHIADLSSSTDAQRETALNAIIVVLRNNGLLDDNS